MPKNLIPYQKSQSGAYYRQDTRDYQFNALARAAGIDIKFDWDKGFDVEEKLNIKLRHENQGSSSSCCGQGLTAYGEVLEFIETGTIKEFSSRRIYSNIYLPQGGAYIQDALKFVTKQSFVLEKDLLSYEDGNPPSEQFMRDKGNLSELILQDAMKWQAKDYYQVGGNIDNAAIALQNGFGLYMAATGSNGGWSTGDLKPPLSSERMWGHAFFGKAARIRNGKKAIKIHNSWGNAWCLGGDAWLNEDYFKSGYIWQPYVLIDKNNFNFMKLIKSKNPNDKTVYLIDTEGSRRAFYDENHFNSIAPILGLAKRKGNNNGLVDWSQVNEIDESELIKYPLGRPMFIVE